MISKWQFGEIGPLRMPPGTVGEEVRLAYIWAKSYHFYAANPCKLLHTAAVRANDPEGQALWSRMDHAIFSMRIAIEEMDARRLEEVADRLSATREADVVAFGSPASLAQ